VCGLAVARSTRASGNPVRRNQTAEAAVPVEEFRFNSVYIGGLDGQTTHSTLKDPRRPSRCRAGPAVGSARPHGPAGAGCGRSVRARRRSTRASARCRCRLPPAGCGGLRSRPRAGPPSRSSSRQTDEGQGRAVAAGCPGRVATIRGCCISSGRGSTGGTGVPEQRILIRGPRAASGRGRTRDRTVPATVRSGRGGSGRGDPGVSEH
jgi:hypothetical protein